MISRTVASGLYYVGIAVLIIMHVGLFAKPGMLQMPDAARGHALVSLAAAALIVVAWFTNCNKPSNAQSSA